MYINYNNKQFRSVKNSSNGEVDNTTLFRYTQNENIVTGTYSGKQIIAGQLIATVDDSGILTMRYQHLNSDGIFKYGHCISTPEVQINGKIKLYEKWQWDCDDRSKGESILEEI